MATHIENANAADIPGIHRLLTQNRLPLDGLDAHLATTLVAREEGAIVGTAALEMYPEGALLRSVAVSAQHRGRGLGHELTNAAIRLARDRDAPAIYLLTTTAEAFFPRFGFARIARADVPAGVQTSIEFTSACPSTAAVMWKRLTAVRIAIFSDVHGNMHALDAVLSDIEAQNVDGVYCLGDLVGYGAAPNEVTARIRRENIPTVMGNYDDGVGFDRDECGCAYREPRDRDLGERSFAWTKAHVTPENRAFLRTLVPEVRFEADGRRVLLVHGSPRRLNEYLFEDRPLVSFERLAASSNADVIVFGHTHKPYVKEVGGVSFVNVGSVGKPKDGDWRACYAILGDAVRFRRVEYDVRAAADAIRATALPHEFAADIESGGASRPAA